MDEMENLLDAIDKWQQKARERDLAVDQCESSADYFCYSEIKAEQESRQRVADALNAIIDQRVEMRIQNGKEMCL